MTLSPAVKLNKRLALFASLPCIQPPSKPLAAAMAVPNASVAIAYLDGTALPLQVASLMPPRYRAYSADDANLLCERWQSTE
jgi:hypothetical protein